MFDLIAGKAQHVPSTPGIPILISTSVQGTLWATVLFASFLAATRELPHVPDMMAFVAELPAVVPPPPPPPAAPPPQQQKSATPTPAPAPVLAAAAPVEAPHSIEPEPASVESVAEGVLGGVVGGIASGVVAGNPGVVERLEPPPPPPVSHEPVRIGADIQAPALVHRVEPRYPLLAQMSNIDGIVILDALVGEDGRVQSVKVLRGHPVLGAAAVDAVQQWRYEPLRFNGAPAAFRLTVSLVFRFEDKGKARQSS